MNTDNLVNLEALGVPSSDKSRPPTLDTMPFRFNSNSRPQWNIAISQVKQTNAQKAWEEVIDLFVKQCALDDVYPFSKTSTNDQILNILISARREVVRFIEKFDITEQFHTLRTTRSVTMTPTGFVLKAMGKSSSIQTPDVLADRLARMGFRGTDATWASIWVRELNTNLKFIISNEGTDMPGRWWYGYEISVDLFPTVPGKPAATTKEMEKFILELLYMPILRAYRPLGLHHRLV